MGIQIVRGVLSMALVLMVILFIWAGRLQGFTDGVRAIIREPWAVVTLCDLYIGLILIACWIFWIERSRGVAAAWTIALLLLGNFAALLYLLRRAIRSKSIREMLAHA